MNDMLDQYALAALTGLCANPGLLNADNDTVQLRHELVSEAFEIGAIALGKRDAAFEARRRAYGFTFPEEEA